jgi:hypothetical protein
VGVNWGEAVTVAGAMGEDKKTAVGVSPGDLVAAGVATEQAASSRITPA